MNISHLDSLKTGINNNETYCYIHIPFCELKCKYCRFASLGISNKLKIDIYVKYLISEIKKSPFRKEILNSIYFGGGTPSVLDENQFKSIINELKNKFGLSKNCEITIESTPNNVTSDNLLMWTKVGINRISIGIQTLNWDSLSEINRGNKGDIELCLSNIKKFIDTPPGLPNIREGVDNISLDFIIGLPYVEPGEILENIKYILNKYNFVKHISVYMLEEYYNPDKIIETKYDNITYPDDWSKMGIKDDEYLKEYSDIKKYLINKGFNNYEISNFGKSSPQSSPEGEEVEQIDYRCRHNIAYWNHNEVYAFGLGAGGLIKPHPSSLLGEERGQEQFIRYLNSDNFKDYYKGEKIFESKLTKNDIFLEKLIFGLRTSGLEIGIYEKLDQNKIDYFIENNYLIKKSDKIILSDSGVLIMDYILGEIV